MRFALGIEYAGCDFIGWQIQPMGITVQSVLESALSKIANQSIKIICAGRTDAGVHATGQVIHFDTDIIRSDIAWVAGTNAILPKSVVVKWIKQVGDDFHARFSALSRSYCYVICNTQMHSAITYSRATWYKYPLDTALMQQGANYLLGEHDFSSFRAAACEANTSIRSMHKIQIKRLGDFVFLELEANAFLQRMVRNIVGVLLKIGAGLKPTEFAQEVLAACNRQAAPETASAKGLYLVNVAYPKSYKLPEGRELMVF